MAGLKSIVLTFLITVISGFSHVANSIEEADYEVIREVGGIEIRHYPSLIQAVTVLPGAASSSEGFRRLAGFIFGGNEQAQKIAMTAPVQETLGEAQPTMAFTMPAQYALEELPRPEDDRVKLQRLEARTVAVVSFSGWATQARVARFERELRKKLAANEIEISGDTSLNQYNPPWTLPFLRRNEIMIEVDSPS